MKPELKKYLEDFELKVNLDENAILELKQNNPVINAKEELAKIKQSRKQKPGDNAAQDVEMNNENDEGSERVSGRRRRADFESGQQELAQQVQEDDVAKGVAQSA